MSFELGKKLAALATELDDCKHASPGYARYTVCLCIKVMHATAKMLLGDRIGEVYNEENDSEISAPEPALFAAADEVVA